MCCYLGIFFGSCRPVSAPSSGAGETPPALRGRVAFEAGCGAVEPRSCGAGWKVGLDLCVNGHSTMWGPRSIAKLGFT